MLSEHHLKKIEELKPLYPTSQALVLPVLWMIQKEHGSISEEAMKYVAGLLDVTETHILGVVTFYTMFKRKPLGKHHIEVCTNVSCMLRGSDAIAAHLEQKLGLRMGETSSDMKWTLEAVECMGSCGTAPMVAINEEYYEDLTPEKLNKILEELE